MGVAFSPISSINIDGFYRRSARMALTVPAGAMLAPRDAGHASVAHRPRPHAIPAASGVAVFGDFSCHAQARPPLTDRKNMDARHRWYRTPYRRLPVSAVAELSERPTQSGRLPGWAG